MDNDNTFTDQDIDDFFKEVVNEEWPHAYVKHRYPCPLSDEKNAGCPAGLGENCEFHKREPN